MMMDDIFFEAPAKCDECNGIFETGTMVWLDGKCLCQKCYAKEQGKAS